MDGRGGKREIAFELGQIPRDGAGCNGTPAPDRHPVAPGAEVRPAGKAGRRARHRLAAGAGDGAAAPPPVESALPPPRVAPITAAPFSVPAPEVSPQAPPDWSAEARDFAKGLTAAPPYRPFGEFPTRPAERPKGPIPTLDLAAAPAARRHDGNDARGRDDHLGLGQLLGLGLVAQPHVEGYPRRP